jgi:diguanylate cyclase (GGDEF)-like protein
MPMRNVRMSITLSSRIGPETPGDPATQPALPAGPSSARPAGLRRPVHDRSLMARCLAYLFGAGAALALVSLALPDNSNATATDIVIPQAGYAVAAVGVVAILLVNFNRLPLWTFHLTLTAGTALISFVIYSSGDPTSAYTMFYVWIALYAFYFFGWAQAFFQIVCVGLAYGAVLHFKESVTVPTARWLITVGTVLAAGVLIAMLKNRVDSLVERLSDSAKTDSLTGLLNRRGFEECFDYELERARRGSGRLSIVLLDLDYFKVVNDRFGHAVGDGALERVGGVLMATKRQIDTAARVGGEEFALLLPETDADGGYFVCERVRERVREAFAADDFPGADVGRMERPLTVSLGMASFPFDGTSPQELLASADLALYEAKRSGRDRTVARTALEPA